MPTATPVLLPPVPARVCRHGRASCIERCPVRSERGVRHEAASIAVGAAHAGPNLRFCPQYPTRTCDQGNPVV